MPMPVVAPIGIADQGNRLVDLRYRQFEKIVDGSRVVIEPAGVLLPEKSGNRLVQRTPVRCDDDKTVSHHKAIGEFCNISRTGPIGELAEDFRFRAWPRRQMRDFRGRQLDGDRIDEWKVVPAREINRRGARQRPVRWKIACD